MRPVSAIAVLILALALVCACDPPKPRPTTGDAPPATTSAGVEGATNDAPSRRAPNLAKAKEGRATKIIRKSPKGSPPPEPAPGFELVKFPSAVGGLTAYVNTPSGREKPGPAVVYVLGGFSNGVGATPWSPAERVNDQSGRAFTEAGLTVMWPSRRVNVAWLRPNSALYSSGALDTTAGQ